MQLNPIVVRLWKRSYRRITMFEQQPTLELLFDQLGLDSDEASIENFIKTFSPGFADLTLTSPT